MKHCERCGIEYGGCYCPLCGEGDGIAAAETDVISAEGLPPYVEEFPVIGYTGEEPPNFAEHRFEIYERNLRLARMTPTPKEETTVLNKPVMPLIQIRDDGEIVPYKPPNPVVQKLQNIGNAFKNPSASRKKALSKTVKRCIAVGSVMFVLLAVIGISWFQTTDIYADYRSEKSQKEFEKNFTEYRAEFAEYIAGYQGTDDKYSCIYGKDNAVMHLVFDYNDLYDFAYINDTGKNLSLADLSEIFSGAEGMENFGLMQIYYPSGANGQIQINDGVLDIENEDFILSTGLKYTEKNIEKGHLIKQGEAFTGYLEKISFSVPKEITVKSESGLELKLTYSSEEEDTVHNPYKNPIYRYSFKFTNTSDSDIDSFCKEFTGAEYADKFYYLIAADIETNETLFAEYWSDGVPQLNRVYTVKPGETVSGEIWLNFKDGDKD
ncbi:MAG: hypothetical protein NC253_14530 [Ruminococcus sp.]|nr:hypothetical protein [Ruminococcus sp.]MCM1380827.1 hypothetical protein [Muribaculaceae bacterium]MCM1480803.1 hypothetical protein [Muribaculaceae bacterium]